MQRIYPLAVHARIRFTVPFECTIRPVRTGRPRGHRLQPRLEFQVESRGSGGHEEGNDVRH